MGTDFNGKKVTVLGLGIEGEDPRARVELRKEVSARDAEDVVEIMKESLLDVHENALQPGMPELNGQFARQFNSRQSRSGNLCGDRYSALRVESDSHRQEA